MDPRVSVCLPTLNSMEFLDARIASIRSQTFTGWNLVAVDGGSDDGTYEEVVRFAAEVPGSVVVRAGREGIYPAFNRCVREASGEFVHIATSDDTMAPDCLEKLVAALDENPDCDIAHCMLRVIDESGADAADWWTGHSLFAQSSGGLVRRRHKRVAPLDGILCMLGKNIYASVTQLLVRRSLFDRIGFYQSDWGSVGDFHWNLRAGLVASTVHVPDTWGSWRVHAAQATAGAGLGTDDHWKDIDSMISDVAGRIGELTGGGGRQQREIMRLVSRAQEMKLFLRRQTGIGDPRARKVFLLREALVGNRAAWGHLAALLPGRARWPAAAPASVASWFGREMLVPLEP